MNERKRVVLVNLDLHQDNLLNTGFGRVLASISRPLIQASALLIVSLVAIICLDVFSRAVLSEPLRGVTELVS
jgi:TRAP-type C4-dicarboxylate transport system permease small subunit